MQKNSEPAPEMRAGGVSSGVAVLGRLTWMIWGPMLSLFIIYTIVTGEGWFTVRDAAFCVVVALMVGGRWVERRSGSAMTAVGEAATVEDFNRYVRVLLPLAAGVWVAANVLGNHVLV